MERTPFMTRKTHRLNWYRSEKHNFPDLKPKKYCLPPTDFSENTVTWPLSGQAGSNIPNFKSKGPSTKSISELFWTLCSTRPFKYKCLNFDLVLIVFRAGDTERRNKRSWYQEGFGLCSKSPIVVPLIPSSEFCLLVVWTPYSTRQGFSSQNLYQNVVFLSEV